MRRHSRLCRGRAQQRSVGRGRAQCLQFAMVAASGVGEHTLRPSATEERTWWNWIAFRAVMGECVHAGRGRQSIGANRTK